jgi:hypothetical protein
MNLVAIIAISRAGKVSTISHWQFRHMAMLWHRLLACYSHWCIVQLNFVPKYNVHPKIYLEVVTRMCNVLDLANHCS